MFDPIFSITVCNSVFQIHCPTFISVQSIQSLSHVQLFATPWIAACQASLSITNSRSSPKLMSIKSVIPSNHLILCCPLLLLPSIFPSTRVFSNESALRMRWPKYWSFSLSISPSKEHPGLISFRMDWLNLLAVQGASILQCSAFFTVQLSHPYMTTGKTISLTRRTFVGKVQTNVSLSRIRLFVTPWIVAYQAPLSMGFSRQEYWSGLPFPSPGNLPHPGIEPRSPTLQAYSFTF